MYCNTGMNLHVPYLLEYKSQLQTLFLLLFSGVRLILRMSRNFRTIGRAEISHAHTVNINHTRFDVRVREHALPAARAPTSRLAAEVYI